jgi:SAM-dependent methyltransferase
LIDLESRSCPICGTVKKSRVFRRENFDPARLTESAFSSRKLPEYMHFRLMKCRKCDLVYASPALRGEKLAEAYRDASFDASRESEYAARTYFRYLRKRTGAKPAATLDIGAGDGAFLQELMRNGYVDVIGYEPSEAPIAVASDLVRPKLRKEMFDGSRIADDTFGLVTCFQTIEHVYEPLKLIREIYRVLSPSGTAFLIGHNVQALSARVLGEKSPIFDIEHYQLFSRRSAKKLMKAAGFRSVNVFPIMNSYPLSYWIKLFPLQASLKRGVLHLLSTKLRFLGDLAVPLPAGNLGIVAIK